MQAALDALWRAKSGMVLATLMRLLRDADLAEEALNDAFLAAARDWPHMGVPTNPAAWLISAGRFRAIDKIRRKARFASLAADMALMTDISSEDTPQPMDLLALIFICCHPALPQDAQVALTLRSICGLKTEEIAAAFLVSAPTMAQRISRAKALLKDRRIPFEVPPDISPRLGPVLAVIYLVFTEGHSAHGAGNVLRPDLAALAVSLARDVHNLAPDAEVKGLLAQMLFGTARQRARLDAQGDLVLLADQDRSLWDGVLIAEGLALLDAAFATGHIGPYVVQAAIAALHVSAPCAAQTDWAEIAALYTLLQRLAPSPIVALNRAVAMGAAKGPAVALPLIAPLVGGALARYAPAHGAYGEVLAQLGQIAPALAALRTAFDMSPQPQQRRHLQRKMDMLAFHLETGRVFGE